MSDLRISFLPRSVSRDWVEAETPEEICNCLEEIALAYQSMGPADRAACQDDMEKIVTNTLRDLICDAPDVVVHGLIVLDHISRDHAKYFVQSLPTMFVRLKRYIAGMIETIRRHATRLSGSLAVHLPLKTVGPHLLKLLHDETVERAITVKLAALALLYSRASGASSSYLQEYAKVALDTCVDHLDVHKLTLSLDPKAPKTDMSPQAAIIDMIAIIIRVFVLDSLFSHALLTDSDSNLFQKCRDQLPADLDDVLEQIVVSPALGKELCWRAQSNEYPTLQNDPIVASFVAYVLSLPVDTCRAEEVEEEEDCGPDSAIRDTFDAGQVFGLSKRSISMGSSSSTSSSPKRSQQALEGIRASPIRNVGSADSNGSASDKSMLYGRYKSYSADFDSPTNSALQSPLLSPSLNKSPSTNNYMLSPTNGSPGSRTSVVSPTAFDEKKISPITRDNGSTSKVSISTSSNDKNGMNGESSRYTFASLPVDMATGRNPNPITTGKELNNSESATSVGLNQSMSSNAISTMPYQPPPTSWGLGTGQANLDKPSPSRSTAGVTTTSTMSSSPATANAAVGIPNSETEDWQRVSLATPWLYLPSTANSNAFPASAGGEGTAGLFPPSKDEPFDRSKLKSLKRPGRNFRSSNTAGANQPAAESESLGETRAYTAGQVNSGDEETTSKWTSLSTDAADSPKQASSSFSGPYGHVGEAIKSINALNSERNGDSSPYQTPTKRKVKSTLSYASPPRHELNSSQLPDIGSATPYEKGSYSDDGKRVQLLAHPHDANSDSDIRASPLQSGIGGTRGRRLLSKGPGPLGKTAISVAQIFDEDDMSAAYEVTEDELESGSVLSVNHRRIRPPVSLDLSINIENSAMNPTEPNSKSDFGPYIESPAVGRGKKASMSPSVAGRGARRAVGRNRSAQASPRLDDEYSDSDTERSKHLPVISGHAEYGVDSNGAPLSKPADQFEYLTSEDVQPLENPSKELNKVTRGLDVEEWPHIFHTINKMRQLALHHSSNVLNSSCLHPMVMGLVKQADNLRSAVCKNALLAITDMLIGFGRAMDGECQNLMPMLLKRSIDSSAFISGNANAALCAMMERISVSRAFALLMQYGAEHKTAGIRGSTANCICHLVVVRTDELKANACKESLESLKSRLGKFMGDPNPNVRAQTREIIRQLVTNGIFTRTQLEACVAPNLIAKAFQEQSGNSTPLSQYSSRLGEVGLQVVADGGNRRTDNTPSVRSSGHKVPDSPLGVPKKKRPSVVSRAREEVRQYDDSDDGGGPLTPRGSEAIELGVSGQGTTTRLGNTGRRRDTTPKYSALQAAHAKQQIDTIGELVELPDMMKKLTSKNWLERTEALSHIADSILERSAILTTAGKLEGLIDAMLEKFEDGSIKVCIHALTCLSKIHGNLPELLPPMYSTVVPAVLTAASSANRQISSLGSEVFSSLVDLIPPLPLMQKLCSMAVHEKDRLRCISLRSISSYISRSDIALDIHLLQRVIFPVICQTVCAGASKPEVRTAANDALRALQRSCNEPVWKWTLNVQHQAEIRRITGYG